LQNNVFPSGTLMLFQQTNAPLYWTKQVTHNDKALRVVSGAASSGGAVAFSSALSSQAVSNTTITQSTMAIACTQLYKRRVTDRHNYATSEAASLSDTTPQRRKPRRLARLVAISHTTTFDQSQCSIR
jgi:hypothetical protein